MRSRCMVVVILILFGSVALLPTACRAKAGRKEPNSSDGRASVGAGSERPIDFPGVLDKWKKEGGGTANLEPVLDSLARLSPGPVYEGLRSPVLRRYIDTMPAAESALATLPGAIFEHNWVIEFCVFTKGMASESVHAYISGVTDSGDRCSRQVIIRTKADEFACRPLVIPKSNDPGWFEVGIREHPLTRGQLYLTPEESSYVIQMFLTNPRLHAPPRANCDFAYVIDVSKSMHNIPTDSILRRLQRPNSGLGNCPDWILSLCSRLEGTSVTCFEFGDRQRSASRLDLLIDSLSAKLGAHPGRVKVVTLLSDGVISDDTNWYPDSRRAAFVRQKFRQCMRAFQQKDEYLLFRPEIVMPGQPPGQPRVWSPDTLVQRWWNDVWLHLMGYTCPSLGGPDIGRPGPMPPGDARVLDRCWSAVCRHVQTSTAVLLQQPALIDSITLTSDGMVRIALRCSCELVESNLRSASALRHDEGTQLLEFGANAARDAYRREGECRWRLQGSGVQQTVKFREDAPSRSQSELQCRPPLKANEDAFSVCVHDSSVDAALALRSPDDKAEPWEVLDKQLGPKDDLLFKASSPLLSFGGLNWHNFALVVLRNPGLDPDGAAVVTYSECDHIWGDSIARFLLSALCLVLLFLAFVHALGLPASIPFLLVFPLQLAVRLSGWSSVRRFLRRSLALFSRYRAWFYAFLNAFERPVKLLAGLSGGLALALLPRNTGPMFGFSLVVLLALVVFIILTWPNRRRIPHRVWRAVFTTFGWPCLWLLFHFGFLKPFVWEFKAASYHAYWVFVVVFLYVMALGATATTPAGK